MRRFFVFSFGVAILGLTGAAVLAAGEACKGRAAAHRDGPPALLLLNRKAVQEELKLSADQIRMAREALVRQITAFVDASDTPREDRQGKMAALREQSKQEAARILTPDQAARFQQIRLQVQGPRAFFHPETAKALAISEEQQQKMHAIVTEAHAAFARAFKEGQADPAAAHKAAAELGQRTREQIMGVLTDAQKAQWKEMTGEPIHGDLHLWHTGAWGHRPGCRG